MVIKIKQNKTNKTKKHSVKLTLPPKMGACNEDRRESGKEAKALLCATRSPVKRHRHTLKSINGHYLFGLFGVVFLHICCHFLEVILQLTTLNFKLIKVSSVLNIESIGFIMSRANKILDLFFYDYSG